MASAATPYRITVEQFLAIKWDTDGRAELDNGVIRMMAGGTEVHSRIQGNIFAALFARLKGAACRPHMSDMGIRTSNTSLRYPDISVLCGKDTGEYNDVQAFDDPKVVIEVLSPSTRKSDQTTKLAEYRLLPELAHILLVDPEGSGIRLLTRTGPHSWNDAELESGEAVELSALGVALSWDEVFGGG